MPKHFKKSELIENANNIFNKLEELEQQAENLHSELRGLRQRYEEEMPTDGDEIEDDEEDE